MGCIRLLYELSTLSLCIDCLNGKDHVRTPEMAEDLIRRSRYGAYVAIDSFGGRLDHVGYRLCRGEHVIFRHCDSVCNRVRPVRGEGDSEMIETLLLGFVTVALLVYLVYALLRPEKF
jgi:K+-transporting ATPase KdpF subunit